MQDEIAKAVIARVVAILHERDIQRQDFAAMLGIKPSSLTKLLSRHKPIQTDSIAKMAKALGLEPRDLMCSQAAEGPITDQKASN